MNVGVCAMQLSERHQTSTVGQPVSGRGAGCRSVESKFHGEKENEEEAIRRLSGAFFQGKVRYRRYPRENDFGDEPGRVLISQFALNYFR